MPPFVLLPTAEEEEEEEEQNWTAEGDGRASVTQTWLQLSRLYRTVGNSDDLLGWFTDRWASPPGQVGILDRAGSAFTAKAQMDLEAAFSEFSEVIMLMILESAIDA